MSNEPSRTAAPMTMQPGDLVSSMGTDRAVFIATGPHPVHDGFQLVVWWLPDRGSYSFDALGPWQYCGEAESVDKATRLRRFTAACKGSTNAADFGRAASGGAT